MYFNIKIDLDGEIIGEIWKPLFKTENLILQQGVFVELIGN